LNGSRRNCRENAGDLSGFGTLTGLIPLDFLQFIPPILQLVRNLF